MEELKRGRLTLIRNLLDRLPDTYIAPPPLDFPELGHSPQNESYDGLQPIENFPVSEG